MDVGVVNLVDGTKVRESTISSKMFYKEYYVITILINNVIECTCSTNSFLWTYLSLKEHQK